MLPVPVTLANPESNVRIRNAQASHDISDVSNWGIKAGCDHFLEDIISLFQGDLPVSNAGFQDSNGTRNTDFHQRTLVSCRSAIRHHNGLVLLGVGDA